MAECGKGNKRGYYASRLLPVFDLGKLELLRAKTSDLDNPVHALGRFATMVFEERSGRLPEPDDVVALRESDDLAIGSMFGIEHPQGVNGKVRGLLHELGVLVDVEVAQSPLTGES